MTSEELAVVRELIAASKPFTDGNTVTETTGTIPLIERLEDAIEAAETILEKEND